MGGQQKSTSTAAIFRHFIHRSKEPHVVISAVSLSFWTTSVANLTGSDEDQGGKVINLSVASVE